MIAYYRNGPGVPSRNNSAHRRHRLYDYWNGNSRLSYQARFLSMAASSRRAGSKYYAAARYFAHLARAAGTDRYWYDPAMGRCIR